MLELSYPEIYSRLAQQAEKIDADVVVAIANGGLIPAAMIAKALSCDLLVLRPQKSFDYTVEGMKALLVDDFSKTGNTLDSAKKLLEEKGAYVQTLVVAGKDALFPSEECVKLPWRAMNRGNTDGI